MVRLLTREPQQPASSQLGRLPELPKGEAKKGQRSDISVAYETSASAPASNVLLLVQQGSDLVTSRASSDVSISPRTCISRSEYLGRPCYGCLLRKIHTTRASRSIFPTYFYTHFPPTAAGLCLFLLLPTPASRCTHSSFPRFWSPVWPLPAWRRAFSSPPAPLSPSAL